MRTAHPEANGERAAPRPRARSRLTLRAQGVLGAVLRPGDWAVDATLGNGHDTLFLARAVGSSGRVLGCDIQPQAVEATHARLSAGAPNVPADLFAMDHARLAGRLPAGAAGRIRGLMMNLGYRPGGDRRLRTGPDTTLRALESLLPFLAPGGRATIIAYTGHPGGRREAAAVRDWLAARSPDAYRVFLHVSADRLGTAPQLYWLQRADAPGPLHPTT